MRVTIVLLLVFVLLVMSACAPGPNPMEREPDAEGEVAGFWRGLWQGIISPFTFIISLFTAKVRFYEVHNNGNWYNLGFVIGTGILGGGGILGSRKQKKD